MLELNNKKVLIWGLGEFGGGLGAAIYACKQGAQVKITDMKTAVELEASLRKLADLPMSYTLGRHDDADLLEADVLVINPAIKPNHRWIELAKQQHKTLTSEIELLLSTLPTKNIMAITGSAGKSTTATLIHEFLKAHGVRSHLGGNIGFSLLNSLHLIQQDDWVVLELSSFQLHLLSNFRFAPKVAIVTSFFPNHLDWHHTVEHYLSSKLMLTKFQTSDDFFIRPDVIEAETSWLGHALRLSPAGDLEKLQVPSTLVSSALKLRGGCNQINAALAILAVWSVGFRNISHLEHTLKSFSGLPHRLEFLANHQGVTYINDSKSTTPESTVVALEALDKPIVLIAGGADKGVDLEFMIRAIIEHCAAVILMGITGRIISEHISRLAPDFQQYVAGEPTEAFFQASTVAKPGSTVLLSPGCASQGLFKNYEHRGNEFRNFVNQLAGK